MESNSGQRLSSEWKRQVYAVGNETQKTSVWSVWSDSWTHTTAGLSTGNAAAPPACPSSGWSAVCRVGGEWAPASANMSASGKNIPQLQTPPPAAFQFLLPSSARLYHLVTRCTGNWPTQRNASFLLPRVRLRGWLLPSSSAGRVLPLNRVESVLERLGMGDEASRPVPGTWIAEDLLRSSMEELVIQGCLLHI